MKQIRFASILILLIFVTAITSSARDIKQVKVFIDDKATLTALQEMALDIVEHGDNYITIITNTDELKAIQQSGFRTEVTHEDIVEFYQARILANQSITDDMGGYKTLSEINAAMDTIILDHPTIISNKIVIGQSLEGRDIWAVKISDNHAVDEDEPEVFYYSATHCREVITPEVLLYFINHLTDNYGTDPVVTDIVDNRELWFVLNVNPDGYVYNEITEPLGGGMWRKNRRDNGDGTFGVDLNRNYGVHWGYDDLGSSPVTSSSTYRGTSAFSEPEAQAMRDFMEAHDFVIAVDYHSYSDLILWPWGYDYLYTEDEVLFNYIGDSIATMNGYAPGPIWTLYLVNGDATDWGYGEQTTKNKILHISPEVGSSSDGFWPNPADIPTLVHENLAPNIFIAQIAGTIYQKAPPKTPTIAVDNLVDIVSYDVNWSLIDTVNPAIEYELTQMSDYNDTIDPADNFDYWNNNGFLLSTSEFATSPSAFYSDSGNGLFNTMTSTIPYLVQPHDTITFLTKYAIETDWDYAYVEISTDGINFSSIEGNITTTTNPNGNNAGHGITDFSSGGWDSAYFDISAFEGQSIYIRLAYNTDSYVVEDGFRVDDFYPAVSFSSSSIVSSTITDTFYTFSGQPTGTYYYKVRGVDAENQWSDYSQTVKTNVVPSTTDCYATGEVNGDGFALSVADLIYLIRFMQGLILAPDVPHLADMNGDCVISPEDTTLYNWYFINGLSVFPEYPVPTCCDVDIDRDGDGLFDPDEQALAMNHLDIDSDDDTIDDLTEIGGDLLNPLDTDNDLIIDALDPDDDGDGILTIDEVANGDTDLDGIPDYLDDDDDNDGVLTISDNCPLVANPTQDDTDTDGIGDACDGCCIADRGNVDGGPDDGTFTGSVDIADLVYLVAYSFTGGAAPPCIAEADIDASGGAIPIDISDIVALVAFMFTGGTAPAACF